jgi:hypothetical protein
LDHSSLQVEDVMELLELCMKTADFQFKDKFHQNKKDWQ